MVLTIVGRLKFLNLMSRVNISIYPFTSTRQLPWVSLCTLIPAVQTWGGFFLWGVFWYNDDQWVLKGPDFGTLSRSGPMSKKRPDLPLKSRSLLILSQSDNIPSKILILLASHYIKLVFGKSTYNKHMRKHTNAVAKPKALPLVKILASFGADDPLS